MKQLFLMTFLCLQAAFLMAQNPVMIWEKTFGTEKNEEPHSIHPTKDGNLLVVGFAQPQGRYDLDLLLMKISTDGQLIWKRTYGDESLENGYDAVELPDGSWMVLGEKLTEGRSGEVWLLKVDPDGELIWDNELGSVYKESPKSILLNTENQVVISGVKMSEVTDVPGAFMMRVDLNGTEISTDIFGSDTYEASGKADWTEGKGEGANKIIQTKDGGYIMVGHTMTKAKKGLATDGWICKIDKHGNKLWTAAVGAIGGDDLMDVFEDAIGNVYVSGERYSKPLPFNVSLWLLKFTAKGEKVFEEHYNRGNFCTVGKSMLYNDKSILLIGASNNTTKAYVKSNSVSAKEEKEMLSNGWEKKMHQGGEYFINDYEKTKAKSIKENIWLVQTDLNGKLMWEKEIEGHDEDDKALAMCKNKDGEIFVTGYTYSKGEGGKDVFILKMN